MSPAATLLYVAAVHWAAMASPGPNVLLVAQTSMARSRAAGLAVALGVASGAVLLASATVLGLSLVVEQVHWLRTAIQVAGGAYLVYLGITVWRDAAEPVRVAGARAADDGSPQAGWRDYRRGLLTNVTNPKAAVFYGSILAPTFDADVSGWVSAAAVVLLVTDSIVFHCGLAVLFARPGVQRGYRRVKPLVDRVVGAALVILGGRLGLSAT